ncbi:hypothetical protein BD414DRAFT_481955 [Trametes punicea]|nr:hypothetical protein BD414DRAFT_481955 [Trametes punicea]
MGLRQRGRRLRCTVCLVLTSRAFQQDQDLPSQVNTQIIVVRDLLTLRYFRCFCQAEQVVFHFLLNQSLSFSVVHAHIRPYQKFRWLLINDDPILRRHERRRFFSGSSDPLILWDWSRALGTVLMHCGWSFSPPRCRRVPSAFILSSLSSAGRTSAVGSGNCSPALGHVFRLQLPACKASVLSPFKARPGVRANSRILYSSQARTHSSLRRSSFSQRQAHHT